VFACLSAPGGGEGGVLPENLGGGVWPASQNPYPLYDQVKVKVSDSIIISSSELYMTNLSVNKSGCLDSDESYSIVSFVC